MTENRFMAGAAVGDITPSRRLMPMPFFMIFKFNRVADPVHVRALALSDGRHKSLFVVYEMTLVPFAEQTLTLIAEATGIPKEYIFVAATHTHEVTPMGLAGMYEKDKAAQKKCLKWYEEIKATTLETVREALGKMVPARIGYGEGISCINANRDAEFPDGISRLGTNLMRPSDKTLRMIKIEDLQGKMIALVVNYACHAVVLNGCITYGGEAISGDFPGRTCTILEEKYKDAVVIWCSGAAGDQNPRIMTQYEFDQMSGKAKVKNLGKKGYIIVDWLTAEHVRDIETAEAGIECTRTDGTLYAAEKTVCLPAAKDGMENPQYLLRILRIGDIMLEGINAEIVTSVGKAVRECSPHEKTILVSHANGYLGYVPDDWEFEHQAFETGMALFKPGTAVPAFVKAFGELFEDGLKNREN